MESVASRPLQVRQSLVQASPSPPSVLQQQPRAVSPLPEQGQQITVRRKNTRGGSRPKLIRSCTECRRRKQRCSQGQPCTNCAKRTPRPVCEYRQSSTLIHAKKSAAGVTNSTRSQDARSLKGFQDYVSQFAPAEEAMSADEEEAVAVFSTEVAVSENALADKFKLCPRGCTRHSSAYHIFVTLVFNRSKEQGLTHHHMNAPNTVYSPELRRTFATFFTSDPYSPIRTREYLHLPMKHTVQNALLVNVYATLLAQYKTCIDGNPGPSHAANTTYIPYSIHDPLLLQINLYTAACFVQETGLITKADVLMYKGHAIRTLNDYLRVPVTGTSDSAILAVSQIILDEWYWGETEELLRHMNGLRHMVKLRGGIQELGMDGYLAKLIVSSDFSIGLSHEVDSVLSPPEFVYVDPNPPETFNPSVNIPFYLNGPSFAKCAEELGLHPVTAAILDDVRSLFYATSQLPLDTDTPSAETVMAQARTLHKRLLESSPDNPALAYQDMSAASSPGEVTDEAAVKGPESREDEYNGMLSPQSTTDDTDSHSADSPSGSTSGSASGSTSLALAHAEALVPSPPDLLYKIVRLTALTYTHAIATRMPLSLASTPEQCLLSWSSIWFMPLTRWRKLAGIFSWIMQAIIASICRHAALYERFARTMMTVAMSERANLDWNVFNEATAMAIHLRKWLNGSADPNTDPIASAKMFQYRKDQTWEDQHIVH